MATWIAPIDTETDPDAPLISSLGKRWDNNVIAAFEGDVGAPHAAAAWHPYNGVAVGDGVDGLIYDHAVDGSVGTLETPFFEDGYEYRILCFEVSSSSTGAWGVDFYLLTDAVWDQAFSNGSINSGDEMGGVITFYEPRRVETTHSCDGGLSNDGALSVVNALGSVYDITAQKVRNIRIDPPGLLNGGRVYMQRRKVEDGT